MIILALKDQQKSKRLGASLEAAGHRVLCDRGQGAIEAWTSSADAIVVASWSADDPFLHDWKPRQSADRGAPRVFALVEPRCGLSAAPLAGPPLLLGRTLEEAFASIDAQASPLPTSDPAIRAHGEFVVNLESMRAWRGDRQLTLSLRQLRALDLFLRHPGIVLTRHDLLRELWPASSDVTSKAITRFMLAFRQRVCPPRTPNQILAVKGFGYAFSP